MDKRLTGFIVFGMIAGVLVGMLLNWQLGSQTELAKQAADYLKLLPDIFLKLIKMIVAPLVFSTIVVGIAHMGDSAALGRIGARAIGWFFIASVISLGLGMLFANLFEPGAALRSLTATTGPAPEVSKVPSLREFVLQIFPSSAFDAMARNDVLQILVFSIFVGVGLSALGERGALLVKATHQLADLMLQITHYVMRFAPFAVFGALAAAVTTRGAGVLVTFGSLIAEFYFALAVLWVILIVAGFAFLRAQVFTLLRYIREPFLIAFSTASSEAALPKLFEQLDRFGVPRRLSGFMLPLGYSFNLDGSMMYMSFATLFIAQAYGVELSLETQIIMLLTLMVTSKGIAAVPRASLVVVTATLASFGLPVEGVALILAIDQVLDMGRTGTNVIGNAIATASIAKWEGMLQVSLPPDGDIPPAPSHSASDGRAGLELQDTYPPKGQS
jgi:Na+/H+-dicarboxylate symporter